MTACCPVAKIDRLVDMAYSAFVKKFITVHNAERLLGVMESVRPVTPLAALNYRSFQRQLLIAKRGFRDPSKLISLSSKSLGNLKWWISDSGFRMNNTAHLMELQPNVCIWT